MTTPPPTDPLIGTTVSQYEIVAKLGGGGMGVVYKARDIKLGRPVALKFLPPQWSHDEGAKQRFVREAQAASATNHRNICVIHNIEETADGRLFIVMAYYEGETLKQKLERGPVPIIEAIELASEIADGLAKAHAQGVIHRDVKPGNLIVTEDGIKILDFGLAKFADALQLTVPGSTIGTVGYMSPEQARGEEADARSDVWALGIVMFEMLTGSVPFRGTYQEATFHAIKNEPLPSLRAARPDIPEALERIVLKALEKDPEKRFQNAREPARDLKLLAGRTVPVDLLTIEVPRPAGVGPDSLPKLVPPRRIFTPTRLGTATALLIAVAAGVYFWISRPIERIPIAVAAVSNQTGFAELEPYRLSLTQAMTSQLSDSQYVRVLSYSRLLEIMRRFLAGGADATSREALQSLATNGGVQFIAVPTLRYENGNWFGALEIRSPDSATNVATYRSGGFVSSLPKETAYDVVASLAQNIQEHFRNAAPRRARILETLENWFGAHPSSPSRPLHTLDAAADFERGTNAYENLDYAAAGRFFRSATEKDPQSAVAFAWLAHINQILQTDNLTREAADKAGQLVSPSTSHDDKTFIAAVRAESVRDFGTAGPLYEELATRRADASSWLMELGAFHYRRAAWSDGVATYRKVLQIDRQSARPHLELCRLYNRLNEGAKAKQEGEAALVAYRSLGNAAGEAQSLMCLTDMLRIGPEEQRADGLKNAEAAVRIFETLHDDFNLARAQYYVALAAEGVHRFEMAVAAYDTAIATSARAGNVVLEPLLLMNVGAMQVKLGRYRPALDYYNRSHELFQKFGDEQRAAQIQANIGSILVENAGKPDEGLRNIANALGVFKKFNDRKFEVFVAKVNAAALRYSGRHADAERELNRALAVVTERNMTRETASLTTDIALSRIELGDYSGARQLLVKAIDVDKSNGPAHIYLGETYAFLGRFDLAKAELEKASEIVQASGDDGWAPVVFEMLGRLAYDQGHRKDARTYFKRSAEFWVDDLPDPASVESRSYLALLDATEKVGLGARTVAEQSLEQARKINSVAVEARCRLMLARVDLLQGRFDKVIQTLSSGGAEGDTKAPVDLQVQFHVLRAQALLNQHNTATADTEMAAARRLIDGLAKALPDDDRMAFLARPDFQEIVR